MERRLVIEQFDPDRPMPGGIDTCIRGLVRYCPSEIELRIAGVDATGTKRLGEWSEHNIGGRVVHFMPVARLDPANLRRAIPHSVNVAAGLLKYRPARDVDIVQTHRINTGAAAMIQYPQADHVQFIHSENQFGKGSDTFFRWAVFAYRWLERMVVPRAVDTVVFSQAGAERLQPLSASVRFSPTWYDPAEFFPASTSVAIKSRIIWPYRIEPGKNPKLAIDVMAALPAHYKLTVAGSGTMESAMRRYGRESPASDRIRFVGAIAKSDIGAAMRDHDLLLMTSSFEGYSRAIVEGLASGLPVVTTPGGDPNGLIKTGINGARVDAASPELFVRAMEIASQVPAAAARDSVSQLAAFNVVPNVLTIPGRHS